MLSHLVLAALVHAAPQPAAFPPAGPVRAPAPGPGAILHMHRSLFAALDRGDAEAAMAFVAPDLNGPPRKSSLFLVGMAGEPVVSTTAAASSELLAVLAKESGAAGGTWKTTMSRETAECDSGEVSYATFEFERVHEVDGRKVARRYLSTSLACYEKGEWRIFHWHVSPAGLARENKG